MLSSIDKVRLGVLDGHEFKNAQLTKRSMDIQLSQTVRADQCHKTMITSMDIDSTGRFLISASYGHFFIHDTFNFTTDLKYTIRKICKSGNQEQHFKGLSTIQWFPNDSGLFTLSSSKGTICLYNTNALKRPVETFGGSANEYYLKHHMNPINPQLISAISVIPNSCSHKINIIDVRIGSKIQTLPSNSRNGLLRGSAGLSNITDFDYCQLIWSPKKSTLLSTGTSQGQIIDWDIRSTTTYLRTYGDENCDNPISVVPVKRSKLSFLKAHRKKILTLRYTQDGNELFSLGMEGTVRRWDTLLEKPPLISCNLPLTRNINVSSMDISGTGKTIYTAWSSSLYVHSSETGQLIRRINGHLRSVTSFVYDNQFQNGFSGGADCAIIVYSPNYLTEKAYLDNLNKTQNTFENLTSSTTSDFTVSKAPLIDMSDL